MAEIYDGKKLKRMRKRLGLTQAKLAKLAGVTQALISSVEHDVEEMAAQDTRARIANVLVVMEHERIVEMGATPNEKIEMLKKDFAHMKRQADFFSNLADKFMAEKQQLLEILNLRTKKALTESELAEKIEALGYEEISPVQEEVRAEIRQHTAKKSG